MDEPAVDWLDREEMRAWRGLVEVSAELHASLEAELMDAFGFGEGDYAVLVNLSEAPDRRLRMCDLAERLHLSPSGLTRRLDGLVRTGYVAREPSASDRRVTLAVLTDAGHAALEAAAPTHVAGVRRHFLDHLTHVQVRQLGNVFDALRGRLVAPRSPSPMVTPEHAEHVIDPAAIAPDPE